MDIAKGAANPEAAIQVTTINQPVDASQKSRVVTLKDKTAPVKGGEVKVPEKKNDLSFLYSKLMNGSGFYIKAKTEEYNKKRNTFKRVTEQDAESGVPQSIFQDEKNFVIKFGPLKINKNKEAANAEVAAFRRRREYEKIMETIEQSKLPIATYTTDNFATSAWFVVPKDRISGTDILDWADAARAVKIYLYHHPKAQFLYGRKNK